MIDFLYIIAALALLLLLWARPRQFGRFGYQKWGTVAFKMFGSRNTYPVFVKIDTTHFGIQCGHTPAFKWWQLFSFLPKYSDNGAPHTRVLNLTVAAPSTGSRLWIYARHFKTIGHIDIYVNRNPELTAEKQDGKTGFGLVVFPMSWKLGLWSRPKKWMFAFGPMRFTVYHARGAWKAA